MGGWHKKVIQYLPVFVGKKKKREKGCWHWHTHSTQSIQIKFKSQNIYIYISQGFKVMSVHKVNHMKKISRACLCNTFPRKRWQFFAETRLFPRLVQQESAKTCFRHVRFFCRKSGIPIPKRGYRTFSSTEKWTPVYKPCFLCHPQNGMRKKRSETLTKKTNEISMPKLVSISLKSFIVDLHSKSSFSLSTFISTSQSIFNPSLFGNTISITITISNPNLNPTPFQLFNFQTLNSTPKL